MAETKARVAQIHDAYCDAEFHVEYYTEYRDRTVRYSKHFDFVIGLGALGGGGSGLGILGEPMFAIPCGILTSVSVVSSIAKSNYDWQGKVSKSQELIDFFSTVATQYRYLVDDLNYRRTLDDAAIASFFKLRAELLKAPSNPYPKMNDGSISEIRSRVEARMARDQWWSGD